MKHALALLACCLLAHSALAQATPNPFFACWALSALPDGSVPPAVILAAQFQADGTLVSVQPRQADMQRYATDPLYHQTADAAMAAVKRCSPTRVTQAGTVEITFDPRALLGGR